MKQLLNTSAAAHGTVGGAAVGFIINIGSGDIQRTTVLAALGTVISFFISMLLKLLISKWRSRK